MPTTAMRVATKALDWLDKNQQYMTMLPRPDAFKTMRAELDIQQNVIVR